MRSSPPIVVRPPWSDPRFVGLSEIGADVLDLDVRFREHLLSPAIVNAVADEARRTLKELDGRRELVGPDVWRLYRSARLSAALTNRADDGSLTPDTVGDYFHALATTDRWYFTDRSCVPYVTNSTAIASADALGEVGLLFEQWLSTSAACKSLREAGHVELRIDDAGQLPFAASIARVLRTNVELRLAASVDPRLVGRFAAELPKTTRVVETKSRATIAPELGDEDLARAEAFFAKARTRALRLVWQPDSAKKLESQGLAAFSAALTRIPIALTFAPRLHEADERAMAGGFSFAALDEVLRHQESLVHFDVSVRSAKSAKSAKSSKRDLEEWARDEQRSQLLRVQLLVELDHPELVPDRGPRAMLEPTTRLVALRHQVVRSRFDLEAIIASLGGSFAARIHPLGKGRPNRTATFRRAPKASRYMFFTDLPTVIPISPDNATYSDVLTAFSMPRPVSAFTSIYEPEDQPTAFALVDTLANTSILRRV